MPEFIFHEPLPEKLKPAFNTPFVTGDLYPSFAKSESLDLHPVTAQILDNMRSLFSRVLQLSAGPSPEELEKVQQAAGMMRDLLESMPDTCPDAPRLPLLPPTLTGAASEASSFPVYSAPPSPPFSAPSSSSSASHWSSSEQHNTTPSISSAPPVPESHNPSHFVLRNQAQTQLQPQYPPDLVYATVRQTALLYARAVAARSPLSAVCPVPHFFLLWSTAFRVPLSEWQRRLGLFLWVLSAVLPSSAHTSVRELPKSLLHIGTMQIGLDHWEVAVEMLRSAVEIVGWLAGGREDSAGDYNGDCGRAGSV